MPGLTPKELSTLLLLTGSKAASRFAQGAAIENEPNRSIQFANGTSRLLLLPMQIKAEASCTSALKTLTKINFVLDVASLAYGAAAPFIENDPKYSPGDRWVKSTGNVAQGGGMTLGGIAGASALNTPLALHGVAGMSTARIIGMVAARASIAIAAGQAVYSMHQSLVTLEEQKAFQFIEQSYCVSDRNPTASKIFPSIGHGYTNLHNLFNEYMLEKRSKGIVVDRDLEIKMAALDLVQNGDNSALAKYILEEGAKAKRKVEELLPKKGPFAERCAAYSDYCKYKTAFDEAVNFHDDGTQFILHRKLDACIQEFKTPNLREFPRIMPVRLLAVDLEPSKNPEMKGAPNILDPGYLAVGVAINRYCEKPQMNEDKRVRNMESVLGQTPSNNQLGFNPQNSPLEQVFPELKPRNLAAEELVAYKASLDPNHKLREYIQESLKTPAPPLDENSLHRATEVAESLKGKADLHNPTPNHQQYSFAVTSQSSGLSIK